MRHITFRKLITRAEEGAIPYSIITWERRATGFESVDRGDGMSETVAIEYLYYVRVDLWLVVFDFQFYHYPEIK